MKILKKVKPRKFEVSAGPNKIYIKHCADIYLKENEQITFKSFNKEYDVVKKDWGFYATPSINDRLRRFGFRTFIVKNSYNKIYIFLVDKKKILKFKKYCKIENQKILKELTNGFNKK